MLLLLVPGVGMGATEAEPPAAGASGHAFGRRIKNVQPYLTALALALLAGVIRG